MGHVVTPYNWKEYSFHRGCSYDVQSFLKSGLIAGGRESKGRQIIFFTLLNPFGDNPYEEELSDDLSKPRKIHNHTKWTTRQDAVHWIHLARAQDKGLQFLKTRSHAAIVYNSVPADCIYTVISPKGERTLFERLDASSRTEDSTQECLAIASSSNKSSSKTHLPPAPGNWCKKRNTGYHNRQKIQNDLASGN